MVRLLSLALSVSIVASTFAYQNLDEVLHKSKINSRQLAPGTLVSRSANTCIGSGWEIEGVSITKISAIYLTQK
jgi:hypothetical protein